MGTERTLQVAPLNRRAAVGTVNTERRTVDVTFTTGAKVLRSNWLDGQFYEELEVSTGAVDLSRLNSGAPFLEEHNAAVRSVLGVVESARIGKGEGIATIRFAAEGIDPAADQVFRKIADGVIRNVSVGYRINVLEKTSREGEKIPTFVARKWTPYEISAVAIGADAGAQFRSEQQTNPCLITSGRNQKAGHTVEPKTTDPQNSTDTETLTRAEIARVAGINHAIKAARLGEDLARKFIAAGTSVDDARGAVLEILAARDMELNTDNHGAADHDGSWGRVTGGTTAGEKFQRAAAQSLIERAAPSLVRLATERGVEGFNKSDLGSGNEFRRMSLLDLARESLERSGVRTRGMGREKLVGMALTTRAGTGDFPILLENAIGKVLLAAYETAADTWRKFCKVEFVPDFRDAPRYRIGTFSTLPVVPEFGEFQNTPIPDGTKLTINTETRGGIISLSRQAIINDDMGAFSDLAVQRGRAAMLTIENEVYRLLALNGGLGPTMADTFPFFDDAARGNVSTTAALTVAAIDADRVKMGAQKDAEEAEFLNLRPSILLVPASLGGAARVLNDMQFDGDPALAKPNSVRGLYSEVVDSPRLSGTRRYSFASPGIAPAIVVVGLEETQLKPYLETQQGWRVDGTEWKVRLDAKVNFFDPKGAVTNAG